MLSISQVDVLHIKKLQVLLQLMLA